MIRLPPNEQLEQLPPMERHGLEVLLAASGLLLVEAAALDVVGLDIDGATGGGETMPAPVASAGRVVVSRALLRAAGSLASAEAEQGSQEEDRHGRVPSRVNRLVSLGSERTPVVSRAGLALRDACRQAAGTTRAFALVTPWPAGHQWAAALTHDVDVVGWWPVFSLLRAAELLRKGYTARMGRAVRGALGAAGSDPVRAGVTRVLAAEHEHGIRSTWFFLAGRATAGAFLAGDVTYPIDGPAARRLVADAAAAGAEIGLHGSFSTARGAPAFGQERARLERVLGAPVQGVRQHFLKMRPMQTQAAMEAAGFTWDATFGFPDRNGFRLGVADPVPALAFDAGRPLALELVPLVWMDRAQSKYQGREAPAEWIAEALDLADACRAVEGLWTGLWHPNLTDALGYPGAVDAYAQLCRELASRRPWFCTVGEAVTWRQQLRRLRAAGVSPDGTVILAGDPPDGVALVDQQDRSVSWRRAA